MKEVDRRLSKKGKRRGRGKSRSKKGKGRGRGRAGASVEGVDDEEDGGDDYIPYYEIEVDEQDEPVADDDE